MRATCLRTHHHQVNEKSFKIGLNLQKNVQIHPLNWEKTRTFDNRKQIGSYVGLTPSPFQSGSTSRDQGISKAGNAKARTTMIELAWLWLRNQPDSRLSVWFRERVGSRKGRIRRIAIVAMARKLLIALWRYLETGVVPEGAVLKSK
jgi:transposase